MQRSITLALVPLALATLSVTTQPATAQEHLHAPPGGAYQKVSTLVSLPEFIPGIGVLYVDPATLPAGPFLAYDKQGNLVSTVYMIPLSALNEHRAFDGLAVGTDRHVDHVDLYYNAGHPGVDEPHYHLVLWYVSRAKAKALGQ